MAFLLSGAPGGVVSAPTRARGGGVVGVVAAFLAAGEEIFNLVKTQ